MRESGYYWITLNPEDDDWVIGLYDKKTDTWNICGDERVWYPEKINEKRIFY